MELGGTVMYLAVPVYLIRPRNSTDRHMYTSLDYPVLYNLVYQNQTHSKVHSRVLPITFQKFKVL